MKSTSSYEDCSFFKKLLFSWVEPQLRSARSKRNIEFGDAPRFLKFTEVSGACGPLHVKNSFLAADVLLFICGELLWLFCSYYLLNSIAFFLGDETQRAYNGIIIAVCMISGLQLSAMFDSQAVFYQARLRVESQTRMRALLVKKVSESNGVEEDDAENIFTNDIRCAATIVATFPPLVSTIFVTVVASIVLYFQFSWISFCVDGLGLVLVLLQLVIGKFVPKWAKSGREASDRRLKLTREAVSRIFTVKAQVMEKSIIEHIQMQRKDELSAQSRVTSATACTAIAIVSAFQQLSPFLLFLPGFFLNGSLDVQVLGAMVVISIIGNNFMLISNYLSLIVANRAGMTRARSYISTCQSFVSQVLTNIEETSDICLLIEKAVVGKSDFRLNVPTIKLRCCETLLISGESKTGKSTLVRGICNQGELVRGTIRTRGCVAFCPQQSVVFDGTIRENIVLGRPFEEARYQDVLFLCELAQDLSTFECEDQTELLDGGKNISGGQVQRIGLARTLYSTSIVFALDEPLSAVDPSMAERIYRKLTYWTIRERKCLLIVSQKSQFRSCFVKSAEIKDDSVIEDEGTRIFEGSPSMLPETSDLIKLVHREDTIATQKTESFAGPERSHGSVLLVLLRTLRTFQPMVFVVGFLILLLEGGGVFLSFWIALFATNSLPVSPWTWFWVFMSFSFFQVAMWFFVAIGFVNAILFSANAKMHHFALKSTFSTFIKYFFEKSESDIFKVFSQNFFVLDSSFPFIIFLCFEAFAQTICFIVPLALEVPITLAILPVLLFGVSVVWVLWAPARTIAVFKNIQLVSQASGSLTFLIKNLHVLRSLGQVDWAMRKCEEALDNSSSSQFCGVGILVWMRLRAKALCCFIIFMVSVVLVLQARSSSSALALVYSFSLCNLVFFLSEFLANFMQTSYPALAQITNQMYLPSENFDRNNPALQDWPRSGLVQFSNVSICFSRNSAPIFDGLSFVVNPGWHIGIVGRTGSGKSSILSVLLGFNDYDGEITIDGLSVRSVNLQELRIRLAVMTQRTDLFRGRLRWNLDPNSRVPDAELFRVLKKFDFPTSDLNEEIDPKQLSAGEQQVLCFARAWAKNCRIFLQDEGTSSLDKNQENFMNTILDDSHMTCFIVSHKVESIQKVSKILIVDYGKLVAYRSPTELIDREQEFILAILSSSGPSVAFQDEISKTDCRVCRKEFSPGLKRKICRQCRNMCCTFCCLATACRLCLEERMQDKYLRVQVLLHEGFSFYLPPITKTICAKCNLPWARKCGVCCLPFCDRCTVKMRHFTSVLLKLRTNTCCFSCFSQKVASVLAEAAFWAGDALQETINGSYQIANPVFWTVDFCTCAVCRAPSCCSSCEACGVSACESCSGLFVVPELVKDRHARICNECAASVQILIPPYGDPPPQLCVTHDQLKDFGTTCCSCSSFFGFLLPSFLCEACNKKCCQRCIFFSAEECVCRNCALGKQLQKDALICDECFRLVEETDVVWLNLQKFHPKCMVKALKAQRGCAHCGNFLTPDVSVVFKGMTLHSECLPAYRAKLLAEDNY